MFVTLQCRPEGRRYKNARLHKQQKPVNTVIPREARNPSFFVAKVQEDSSLRSE
jgi:hypothetical protein